MSDDTKLGSSLGMGDSHTIRAKPFEFDRSKKVDAKIADAVWDIVQGKIDPTKIVEPEESGILLVPVDYVKEVAWWIAKRLSEQGCRKGFSVGVIEDEPMVLTEYVRYFDGVLNAEGELLSTKKEQRTDCALAFERGLVAERVGKEAADAFIFHLNMSKN